MRSPEIAAKVSASRKGSTHVPLPWPRVDICECGCGEVIPQRPRHRYWKPRYIHLHFLRMNNSERGAKIAATKKAQRLQPPEGWTPPSGVCECGCGGQTSLVTGKSRPNQGAYLGYRRRFLPGHHARLLIRGANHQWRGERITLKSGYVKVFMPDHRPENLVAMTPLEHKHAHRVANEIVSLLLDDRLLDAARKHVREHGKLPSLEALTAQVYGVAEPA